MRFSTSTLALVLLSLTSKAFAVPTPFLSEKSNYTPGVEIAEHSEHASHIGDDELTFDPMDETPGSGGEWNVIVDDEDPRSLQDLMDEVGVKPSDITHTYNNTAFKGFSGSFSHHCVTKMSNMTGFRAFEPEMTIKLADIQVNAPWGLQRLSQQNAIQRKPQSAAQLASNEYKYTFAGELSDLGKGVDIYIFDTGVNVNHLDFGGRASWGYTFDKQVDDQGHGTHVAGTAAGTVFGIAKGANIISVRVMSSSGSSSLIINGLDYVAKNHERRLKDPSFRGSIVSMSLGSDSRSRSIDEAVKQANRQGIHFSVAAGNENRNACQASPAGVSTESNVITVGATTIDDRRADYSNFGQCTTVYAPGTQITSSWIGGNNKINTISGTSMACPHVTGLMAYYLGIDGSYRTNPGALKQKILSSAKNLNTDKGVVKFINNGF